MGESFPAVGSEDDLVFDVVSALQRWVIGRDPREVADAIPDVLPPVHHCVLRSILTRALLRAFSLKPACDPGEFITRLADVSAASDHQLRDAFVRASHALEHHSRIASPDVRRELSQVLMALKETPRRRVRLAELADQLQLSRWHAGRLVRSVTGKPLSQYAREIRMHHAADELRRGTSVKAVAGDLGYPEPSAFCRDFRRVHGLAPRLWAERLWR